MERRVAPRRVIDPSPSPRRNPIPVAVAVGRPIGGNAAGEPDMGVVAVVAPVAVIVEVIVAYDIVRDVLRRPGGFVAMITAVGPIVERVRTANLYHIGTKLISAGESRTLAGVDGEVLAVAGRFAFTLSDADHRVGAVFAGLHAIAAALKNGKRLIGCVHFKNVVAVKAVQVDVERAGGKL